MTENYKLTNIDNSSLVTSKFIANRLQSMYGYDDTILDYVIVKLHEASLSGITCLATYDLQSQISFDLAIEVDLSEYLKKFPKIISDFDNSVPTAIINLNGYLLLRNNYVAESKIIDFLLARSNGDISILNKSTLDKVDIGKLDYWQQLAVVAIYSLPTVMVSGGAGTGKTTTLTKSLELLLVENPSIKIAVCAPTGKAVKRLKQSIFTQTQFVVNNLIAEKILSILSNSVKTVHQLLGISSKTSQAFKTDKNPFIYEVIIIDEVSMLSNQLFLQLINAMMPNTKLVLLGDENQLPAVNSSSFFNSISKYSEQFSSDFICLANDLLNNDLNEKLEIFNSNELSSNFENESDLIGSIGLVNQRVKLKKSFRFDDGSLIYKLSKSVINQNSQDFIKWLISGNSIRTQKKNYLIDMLSEFPKEKTDLLKYIKSSIILCAAKKGQFSTSTINEFLDKNLRHILQDDLIRKNQNWYVGRPIMIERNDYQLDIFNGDIGFCVFVDEKPYIEFDDKILSVDLIADNYALAFAITIHKSQGSEYDYVQIVIDDVSHYPLNNAMLYTAVTRAKKTLKIYANIEQINSIINKQDDLKTICNLLLEPVYQ